MGRREKPPGLVSRPGAPQQYFLLWEFSNNLHLRQRQPTTPLFLMKN